MKEKTVHSAKVETGTFYWPILYVCT